MADASEKLFIRSPISVSDVHYHTQVDIQTPRFAELNHIIYFKLKATAKGGLTANTDNINIRIVDCFYTDITVNFPFASGMR